MLNIDPFFFEFCFLAMFVVSGCILIEYQGGGFKNVIFITTWGDDPISLIFFQNGWEKPPTR